MAEPGIENVYKKADESELELEEEQTAGQGRMIAPGGFAEHVPADMLGATAEEKKLQKEIATLKKTVKVWTIAAGLGIGIAGVAIFKPKWLGIYR
jgi:hypothetical protein